MLANTRRRFVRPLLRFGFLVGVGVLLWGCEPRPSPSADADLKPGEKRHPMRGEVITVSADRKVALVAHEEIPGYMPAMTMEFHVTAAELLGLKEGQRIRGDMIEQADGEVRLEKIWPDDRTAAAEIDAATNALVQDTTARGRSAYREVNETVPDFSLYDQEGRVVSMQRFRGRKVMLNFIYTRCPIATMCPAATAKMMSTQRLAKEAGVTGVEFVSITLDPKYDTPGILKEYAQARGIDTSNFSFLTGPKLAIDNLFTAFGILADLEGGLAKHTLATLLIDENGRIVHRADGSQWSPDDFVKRLKR